MINSTREWDWMDGEAFDVMMEAGAFLPSPPKAPRAFSPLNPNQKEVKEIPLFEGTLKALNGLSLYSS